MSDESSQRSGLTLIEALVALVVSAIIMGATAAAVQEAAGYELRAKTDQRAAFVIERLRRALSADLAGLAALSGPTCLTITRDTIEGRRYARVAMTTDSDLLCLCDENGFPTPAPAARRVTYLCREEGGAVSLIRVEGAGATGGLAVPVLRGLTSFAVEPVDGSGSDKARIAPRAVRFTVSFGETSTYRFSVGIHANGKAQ